MSVNTATVIGATGLIGSHLVRLLQEDDDFKTIRLLVRHPLKKPIAKAEVKLIDFNDVESFKLGIDGSDVVFCAVGTTQKKVKGDKQAYRKVDFDIPVSAARFCKETQCFNFIFVSSIGANANSSNFYLKLKGETEDAIRAINVPSTSAFRPSMLLGDRQEKRTGEKIMQSVMKSISFIMKGKMQKYKPVDAVDVAKAMILAAKTPIFGFNIYEYDGIMQLLNNNSMAH